MSSRATAHRAASSFVSLSASQSRSTHCQTGRARRRHLRVREDIPATRDTHHTKQPPTDRREGGREGRKEGGGQGTPSPRRRGRKERPTAEPTQAGLPYRFVCCAARAEPTPTIRLRLRAASTPPPLRLLRRTFFAPHADSSTTDTSVAATCERDCLAMAVIQHLLTTIASACVCSPYFQKQQVWWTNNIGRCTNTTRFLFPRLSLLHPHTPASLPLPSSLPLHPWTPCLSP